MHGEKNFPLQKMKSSLDINLPDKCDDSLYMKLLEEHLPKVYELSKPEICFYLAGVDVMKGDKLGRLDISKEGLERREKYVLEFLARRKVPTVVLTAGGYAKTATETALLHAVVFRVANSVSLQFL